MFWYLCTTPTYVRSFTYAWSRTYASQSDGRLWFDSFVIRLPLVRFASDSFHLAFVVLDVRSMMLHA
jgi:hypothetical protein